jgi:hyperosmotically inducible protein
VLRFPGMRLSKIVVLALAGASLAACERAAPRTSESEPRSLPAVAAASPEPKAEAPAPAPAQSVAKAPSAPAPATISDAFITGEVRAALMGDPGLEGSDVSVNTSQGVVSLTGHVRSREQAAIAAAHAEGEDGVMRVDNTLVVMND